MNEHILVVALAAIAIVQQVYIHCLEKSLSETMKARMDATLDMLDALAEVRRLKFGIKEEPKCDKQ